MAADVTMNSERMKMRIHLIPRLDEYFVAVFEQCHQGSFPFALPVGIGHNRLSNQPNRFRGTLLPRPRTPHAQPDLEAHPRQAQHREAAAQGTRRERLPRAEGTEARDALCEDHILLTWKQRPNQRIEGAPTNPDQRRTLRYASQFTGRSIPQAASSTRQRDFALCIAYQGAR